VRLTLGDLVDANNERVAFARIRRDEGPDNTTISLTVPGAAPEQIEQAVVVACRLFDAAGVHPHAAATCAFRRNDPNADPLTDEQHELADLWDDATLAALDVACEGMPMEPDGWSFKLDWPGRTEPQAG
jgi:hypothetical protein